MRKPLGVVVFLACGACSGVGASGVTPDPGSAAPTCAPTKLASTPSASFDMATPNLLRPLVAHGYVYWAAITPASDAKRNSPATIYRVATSGGPTEILATFGVATANKGTSLMWGAELAVDESSLYWVDAPVDGNGVHDAAIMRANLDGTGTAPLIAGLTNASGLALGANALFFQATGSLMRSERDGSGVTTLMQQKQLFLDQRAAFGSDYVYVTDGPLLARITYDHGMPTDFVGPDGWQPNAPIDGPGLGGLSLGDTDAYAISASRTDNAPIGPGRVMRLPLAGGTSVVIADGFTTGPAWDARSALDETYVYFNAIDAIMRAPRTGGALATVGPTHATGGITVDPTRVYWTSIDDDVVSVWTACK